MRRWLLAAAMCAASLGLASRSNPVERDEVSARMDDCSLIELDLLSRSVGTYSPVERFRVQIFDRVGLSLDQLEWMADEVDRIWEPYGIEFEWTGLARAPGGWWAPQAKPLRIVLELPGHAPRRRHLLSLASIVFLRPGVPYNVITVYPDVARELLNQLLDQEAFRATPAALADRYLSRILGRATAHEIGHYLLASSEHLPSGLMRSSHTVSDLARPGLGPFRLDPAQARRIGLAPPVAQASHRAPRK